MDIALVWKEVENGTITEYTYSGLNIVKEVENGTTTRHYVYGPSIDEPFYQMEGSTRNYYYPDGLGSIKRLTDGVNTNEYNYDVWGQLAKSAGTIPNSYGYTGREAMNQVDWWYLRNRELDSGVGRFGSADPVDVELRQAFEINSYGYVGNNPVQKGDPLGLAGICHGNFCGPEKWCGAAKPGAKPVDCIDAGCKDHDDCYGFLGISGAAPDSPCKQKCDKWICEDVKWCPPVYESGINYRTSLKKYFHCDKPDGHPRADCCDKF